MDPHISVDCSTTLGGHVCTKFFCIALLGGTSAFAQTTSNPCDVPTGTPLPPGCIPLTYKPADGGPERPVFLGFTPGPEPVQMGPVRSHRGGGAQAAAEKPFEFDLGVDASYAKQDYRADANILTGVFVTVTGRHLGGEVNAHYTVVSRGGIRENTLLAGPRYSLINNRKLVVYAKASFGVGHFGGNPLDPAGANGKNYFVQS